MNRTCWSCKETKDEKFFSKSNGKFRNECKRCKREAAKLRRSQMSSEETKLFRKKMREKYRKNKELMLCGGLDFDAQILRWAKLQLNRKTFDRTKISLESLLSECRKAKNNFPYISFLNLKELNVPRSNYASIDKIDPDKNYSNENIRVIPVWLNSAKLNQSEEDLINKMLHFLKWRGVM